MKNGGQKGGLLWTIANLQITSVPTVSVVMACALTTDQSGKMSERGVLCLIQESSVRRHTG